MKGLIDRPCGREGGWGGGFGGWGATFQNIW